MLDPRIYRAALIVVALAVMVFAFSLENEPGALHTALAPQAFSTPAANITLSHVLKHDPQGSPGSAADSTLADYITGQLQQVFGKSSVSKETSQLHTVDGTRTVDTVTAVDPGLSNGTIVIVAPRDQTAAGAPAEAGLSATAVLIQLASVIHEQSLRHTVEFVSTSGTAGGAGTAALAQQLAGQPVDAVIVLGDLDAQDPSQPVVIPWSDDDTLAPPVLRNTLASALGGQAGVRSRNSGIPAQLARLAFPLTTSAQGPFAAAGEPAVLISLSGERGPRPGEALSPDNARMGGVGQALLQSIDAIDAHATIPPPDSYLTLNSKVVPFWAVRLLILALLIPVLAVTVDGLARSRRRGHVTSRWIGWVLSAGLPFLLGGLIVVLAKVVGVIGVAPPGPLGAGAVPFGATALVVLIAVVLVVVAGFGLLRPLCNRLALELVADDPDAQAAECAGPALLLVACLAALALWALNPYAAALLVPALHLWVWVVDADIRIPRPVAVLMLLIGLTPPILVIVYYVHALGLSVTDVLWNGALLIAGGQVDLVAVLLWSVVLGCLAGTFAIALSAPRARELGAAPVTVRGPITYAGPGSLGGTESAFRR